MHWSSRLKQTESDESSTGSISRTSEAPEMMGEPEGAPWIIVCVTLSTHEDEMLGNTIEPISAMQPDGSWLCTSKQAYVYPFMV